MLLNSIVWFAIGIVSMILVYAMKGVPIMWVAIITAIATAAPAVAAAVVSIIHAGKSKDCATEAQGHAEAAKTAASNGS